MLYEVSGVATLNRSGWQFSPEYPEDPENQKELANIAFSFGAEVNNGKDNGLFASSYDGQYEMVKWLLEHGANPTIEFFDGSLPIDYVWRSTLMSHHFEETPEEYIDREEELRKIENADRIYKLLIEYGSRPAIDK